MAREFPDWISPQRSAEGKRIFAGTIPLPRMQRLAPLLANAEGEVSFMARFGHDQDNRVVIDLKVDAVLPLVCQASLEVYDETVNRCSELAVIARDSELADLPANYDTVRTEKGRLALISLVEDELLLSIPQFPRKPGLTKIAYSTEVRIEEKPTSGEMGSQDQRKTRPFAALKQMLERKEQD